MPKKIILPNGSIEYVDTPKEGESKKKYKAKKKATDLTTKDLQELVYELARRANLL